MPDSLLSRWSHPSVLLVATDLSDLDRLMPFALAQATQTGAHLILLHAIATAATVTVDSVGMPFYDPAAAIDAAEKALLPWCETAARRNIACDAVVREGDAAQQIADAARQFRADRIVLGTRGRSKLRKLLLGSVAEQVLRSANLPVMTVGPEAHLPVEAGEQPPIVLHATTLRETSRPSAALACQIAARHSARLVLLHVLPASADPKRKGEPTREEASVLNELRRLAAETASGCCVEIEPLVVHGNPLIEILATAASRHASLIVLGATHRRAFENLTRDRTVLQVLAHARCPVITLRESMSVPKDEPEHAAIHA
jgi:nucleotide-binding universal stress UspA family protein